MEKICRRTAAALMAAVLLTAMCSGCGKQVKSVNRIIESANANVETEVNVSLFGFKADSLNLIAIENTLHSFMDEYPRIDIDYEGMKGTPYWTAFDKRVATDNMDDIIMVDHDHVVSLSAQGKLADLSDLKGLDNFAALAKSQFIEDDGSVYFVPTCISTFGLYCNLDLLEAHGQKVPENWAELEAACDYFVSQGITPIIGNNYSTMRTLAVAKGLYSVYQSDQSSEIVEALNSDPDRLAETLRPGLDMVETMLVKGWFNAEETLNTAPTSDDLKIFAEGERPFMVTGSWASPRVSAMDAGFEFAVYPYPILDDGSVMVMDVNTCISVTADSACLEEAKQFVEYILQPDVMWAYCDSQSSFTPLQDDRTPSDPCIAPQAPYLTNGRSVIGSDYNLSLPLDTSLLECTTDMLGGTGAQEAAEKLTALLEEGAQK